MASLPLIRGPGKGLRGALRLPLEASRVYTAHKAVRPDCDCNEKLSRGTEAHHRSHQANPVAPQQGIHEPTCRRTLLELRPPSPSSLGVRRRTSFEQDSRQAL